MYLADLLNSRGLFQRTSSWKSSTEFADDVSLLLSRGTSAVISILKIEQTQLNCVREFELFENQLNCMEDRIVFNSQSLVELQNEISPLLSTLRIMQDVTVSLISKSLKISLPSSINDTIKKIEKYGLPNEVKNLLCDYWNSGGASIRDYRILDQHFTGISDRVFLQLQPAKKVLLLFPDNPKEKSKKSFTFDKEICGISVLRVGFDEVHKLIESIADYLGYQPSPLPTSTNMYQLGDLHPSRNRLLSFIFETPLSIRPDGSKQINISGIRISQLEDGKLQLQNMFLTKDKLKKLIG
ncbi:MAG: hypothetical protein Q7U10_09440 [Thermodesulfovibrionia bacterium]|nr:hypothetical protein [Thermodesulfovibrionia bacterium]